MKRKLMPQLLDWKESSQMKPILLLGARGVGKSYLAYDFAKTYYSESIYINFEREPYLCDLFTTNDGSLVGEALRTHFHLSDSNDSILIILDEITACPNITRILPLIMEAKLSCDIIAISSILDEQTIPVDLFTVFQLFPLDFEEFLTATGNEWYIEVIRWHYESNKALPGIVHQELLSLLDEYLQIGGMPIAVNEYINTESKYNLSEQHRILLSSYLFDVNGHNSEGDTLKIIQAYSTIDKQLIKENRKFQYTLIRKGATQAIYADALQYIQDTFYGMRCNRIGDETLAKCSYDLNSIHSANDTHSAIKLYLPDVGMLYSMIRTQYSAISDSLKKVIIENYVAQSLRSSGYPLHFWESSSQAKIDFIIVKEETLVPIEVRANDNTRSKNISIFKTKYSNMIDSIKISTRNFDYSNHVKYVPIYAVFCI